MNTTDIPFVLRGLPAVLHVSVYRNADPRGLGCHLLDPDLPDGAAEGFAVCEASVETDLRGYAAAFGWIQVVRSSDDSSGGHTFALDPLALYRDVNTPFAFFGIKPVLFDAPFRAQRNSLAWEAQTFLCIVPDAVLSREVTPVVGFSWGFDLRAGVLSLRRATPMDPTAWDAHTSLLAETYPSWNFAPTEP